MNDAKMLTMTQEKFMRFKRHYTHAVSVGKTQFVFEEHVFLVSYAKYFIEYLETQFPKESK